MSDNSILNPIHFKHKYIFLDQAGSSKHDFFWLFSLNDPGYVLWDYNLGIVRAMIILERFVLQKILWYVQLATWGLA